MKVERLSESDVADCLAFLEWHKRDKILYGQKDIVEFLDHKKITKRFLRKLKI